MSTYVFVFERKKKWRGKESTLGWTFSLEVGIKTLVLNVLYAKPFVGRPAIAVDALLVLPLVILLIQELPFILFSSLLYLLVVIVLHRTCYSRCGVGCIE